MCANGGHLRTFDSLVFDSGLSILCQIDVRKLQSVEKTPARTGALAKAHLTHHFRGDATNASWLIELLEEPNHSASCSQT